MSAVLFHNPVFGTATVVADRLYFYQTGTNNALAVYTDVSLTATASFPIIADADGRFVPVYFNSEAQTDAKVVLTDAGQVQKWTVDNYPVNSLTSITANVSQNASDIIALAAAEAINASDIDQLEVDVAGFVNTTYAAKADNALQLVGNEFSVRDGYSGYPCVVFADITSISTPTSHASGTWVIQPTQTLIVNTVGAIISGSSVTLPAGQFYFTYTTPLKNSKSDTHTGVKSKLFNLAGTEFGYGQAVDMGDWQSKNLTGCGVIAGGDSYQVKTFMPEGSGFYRPVSGASGDKMHTVISFWKIGE